MLALCVRVGIAGTVADAYPVSPQHPTLAGKGRRRTHPGRRYPGRVIPAPAEPASPDPSFPRWSRGAFPRYRYVPGRSPHPRGDPRGHSRDRPEPRPERLAPADWARSPIYLRGVDLFNFAYWWESHEAFEALWRGAGQRGPEGDFFQGLIQVAASELKRFSGADAAARALAERALKRLRGVPSPWFGLDVQRLAREIEERMAGTRPLPPLLRLAAPPLDAGGRAHGPEG